MDLALKVRPQRRVGDIGGGLAVPPAPSVVLHIGDPEIVGRLIVKQQAQPIGRELGVTAVPAAGIEKIEAAVGEALEPDDGVAAGVEPSSGGQDQLIVGGVGKSEGR